MDLRFYFCFFVLTTIYLSYQMETIAVLADYKSNRAVWNALKVHLDFILQCGYNVELYLSKDDDLSFIQNQNKYKILYYTGLFDLNKKLAIHPSIKFVYCISAISVYKVLFVSLFTKSRIIFWVQGTIPDESFLRHKKMWKKNLLLVIEYFAFRLSHKFVFVSESMVNYYTKRISIPKSNYIVVPCLPDFTMSKCDHKVANSFVYIGGLSPWQCFEEALEIYNKVSTDNSVFHVITHEIDLANKIINEKVDRKSSVQVYSITDRAQIPRVLSQFQFGFLIRKASPVNYVSSPIKFLEYLSCGVNVIMTDAIPSYAKIIRDNLIGTIIDVNSDSITLCPFNNSAHEVYNSLFPTQKFSTLYNTLLHS